MTSVFRVNEEFTCGAHHELIVQNYRLIRASFPEQLVEFFYYIKPAETERFFIIRIKNAEREKFIETVENFAENMCFVALNAKQIKDFLNRTEALDDYV
ncbi:MAG TPA: hypothetical protein VK308_12080 [Pyrinomonadaceae bacterium]|nr:hypothetical protein [Pyrinomonadaceae bacterium]